MIYDIIITKMDPCQSDPKLYYTLFKSDGKIIKILQKPNIDRLHKLLECEYIDSNRFGFVWNNKDIEDTEIVVDDLGVPRDKPINRIVCEALNKSVYWRNRAYIQSTGDSFKICGHALIITTEELDIR